MYNNSPQQRNLKNHQIHPNPSHTTKTRQTSSVLQKSHEWTLGLPPQVLSYLPQYEVPQIIAVGGAKGGVGKSLISANLAARLAIRGSRVLLIDLDLGSANIHTYLGVSLPNTTIADVIMAPNLPLGKAFCKTQMKGLMLVPGGRDETWSEEKMTFDAFWKGILHAKQQHDIDFVVIDLGAGIHPYSIDAFATAHMGIATILPEPTSIENAYSFMKVLMVRLVDNIGKQTNRQKSADAIKEALTQGIPGQPSISSHLGKLNALRTEHPALIDDVLTACYGRHLGVIVNQIRSQKDIDVGRSMGMICRNYFGYRSSAIGYLNYDDAAWKSLRNRRLLIADFPHSILTRRISEISEKVLSELGCE